MDNIVPVSDMEREIRKNIFIRGTMIVHRIFFGILFCVIVVFAPAGCRAPASTDAWAVIPERRAKEMGLGTWLFSGAEIEDYWTPSEGDVLLLEEKLPAFLQENSRSFRREPPVWQQLDSYKRQYAGLVMNGRKII